jgi:hypothetical protein
MDKRYESILAEVRKKFPELKNLKIRIRTAELVSGSMRATRLYAGHLLIIDERKYRGAGRKEIAGAFAHELSHFLLYKKMSWARYFFWYLHYHFSRKFKHRTETNIDRQAIRKGFARELHANRTFIIKSHPLPKKKKNRAYLTPEEIKRYALSINKW